MIFNIDEIVKTLIYIKHHYELDGELCDNINALIGYFANKEPKLTFDEFKQLFSCSAKYLDKENIEINIVPKKKVYMHIDKSVNYPRAYNHNLGISINTKLEESLLEVAYMQFKNCLKELKNG